MSDGLDHFVCDTGFKRIMNRSPGFFWSLMFPELRATIRIPGADKELVESERSLRGDGLWEVGVENRPKTGYFWCEAFTRYDKSIPVRVVEYKTGKHREHLAAYNEVVEVYAGAVVLTHPPKNADFSLAGLPEIAVPHVVMPWVSAVKCLEVEGAAGGALAVLSDERNFFLSVIVERLNEVEDERQWRSWASIVFAFAAAVKDKTFFRNFMDLLQTTVETEKIQRLKKELEPVLDVLYEMRYEEGVEDGFSEGKKEGFSEGKKEGFSEGKKEGVLGTSLKFAAKLLSRGMSVEEVAEISELELDQVEALASANGN